MSDYFKAVKILNIFFNSSISHELTTSEIEASASRKNSGVGNVVATLIHPYTELLTQQEWIGAYQEGISDIPGKGLTNLGIDPNGITWSFKSPGNGILRATRTVFFNESTNSEDFVGSVAPNGRIQLMSLEDTDRMSGFVNLKNGTFSLSIIDQGSDKDIYIGSQTASYYGVWVGSNQKPTPELLESVNKQATVKINSFVNVLTTGDWVGAYQEGLSDVPGRGLTNLNIDPNGITWSFESPGNGILEATRTVVYKGSTNVEQFLGAVGENGQFQMTSLEDTDRMSGLIDPERGAFAMFIIDQGSDKDIYIGSQTASYFGVWADRNMISGRGSLDRFNRETRDRINPYIDRLTGVEWMGEYQEGLSYIPGRGLTNLEIDPAGISWIFKSPGDGIIEATRIVKYNDAVNTEEFIGSVGIDGLFQMISLDDTDRISGTINLEQGTLSMFIVDQGRDRDIYIGSQTASYFGVWTDANFRFSPLNNNSLGLTSQLPSNIHPLLA